MNILVCIKQVPASSNVKVDTAQVGPETAEFMRISHISAVPEIVKIKSVPTAIEYMSGEHGIGYAKKGYMQQQYGCHEN